MLLLICTIVAIVSTFFAIYNSLQWWLCILTFLGSYVVVIALFFLTACIFILLFGKKERTLQPKKIFGFYTYLACEFVKTFFRIKVIYEGKELLEGLKGYELVCNHQSNFDPILMIRMTKRKDTGFIMKKEVMSYFIIGKWLYSGGFYPLDRENNRDGLKTIVTSVEAIKKDRPMGIFVEGTRSKGPNIGPFRDGAFKMAIKAKSPIVVCVIDNSYSIHKNYPFKRTTVFFKICRVLKYEEIENLNTKEIDELVRNEMETALAVAREKYKYNK